MCGLQVSLSRGIDALCTVPIRFPRCVAGGTWGLQNFGYLMGGCCREYFDRASLPEVRARSVVTRAATDAR